ncbi:hypothetical protein MSNKSG1_06523 [Marinobacter santoriniensis NKSG1]|uniref:FimV N-terminal domain-containing protein n=1 Tax=Marinobacter santoriniensis NKSG1 TaxID=1288826 RepID=M7CQQ7_9GAMM|nr:FimV/HubP family polar landmark protein [Marinobacter santoriniensis]EMP55504.1 hypothetical protein MSNKSG1_06523 [Marinobacter santoriniensis NKSG1]
MKVRKLAVALALAGGLGSGVAQALGLGEIELQSYLNEPLDAEIVLPQSEGVSPGDVFVNLAPESAYERVGLDRSQFLSKLRFEVVTGTDGNLVVNVSSREPLREPYLNFLLELTWPNGRLMREYAVLVDPPVYAEQSGVKEQVAAPTTPAASTSRTEPARSPESVRRQAQTERAMADSGRYAADTFGPTGPSDTLWTIAAQVRPNNSVSMQQVMLALQDQNPDAFMGGNINRLKRGEVLRIPSLEQIQQRSRAEATRLVSQQNEEFKSPKRTVDATATKAPTQDTAAASSGGDELKLLVADNKGAKDTADGGSAGGDSKLPGGVDAGNAVAMEELESARRENADLNSRVEDLQDQVQTLQRLLELKNSQLADLQQMTGEQDQAQPAPATSGSPEADTGSDVAETAPDQGAMPENADQPEAAAAGEPGSAQGESAMADSGAAAEAAPETGQVEQPQTSMTENQAESGSAEATAQEPAQPAASESPDSAQPQVAAPSAEEPAQQESPQAAAQPAAQEKGFPGNIIDRILNNPMYQIGLGGGLIVLLLLLLLLARRNANREKAFYEQLNSENEEGSDSFDLSLDEEETEKAGEGDAISEADAYIAYGRHDQAAQTLETAISREPSRTDLRLKLLGVYADSQDRDSFEKQYGEVEALDDEQALAEANVLRERLEEAEAMPSIDDLESQLRSDSFGSGEEATETSGSETGTDEEVDLSDELLADQYDSGKQEEVENEFGDFDSDIADFDLSEVEQAESSSEEAATDERDDMIEFDMPEREEASEESGDVEAAGDADETDYSSLEIDLEDQGEQPETAGEKEEDLSLDFDLGELEETAEEASSDLGEADTAADSEETVSADDLGGDETSAEQEFDGLDESFLDELDAELDKVADDEEELGGEEMEESSLDDLELDVSDEDLALMEEFSDSADSTNHGEEETPELDEELDLEDTLSEGDVLGEGEEPSAEQEVADTEELGDLGSLENLAEQESPSADDLSEEEVPVASEEVSEEPEAPESRSQSLDLDESDLGDDDDFDFLAGTDEAATKLDLARAYIEMGDSDGARDILEEVALEGNDEQKAEAQDLLKNLS